MCRPSVHGGRHFQNKPAVFDDAICFFKENVIKMSPENVNKENL